MGCCMTDKCSIPGHHHKSQPPQTQQNDMPMDCGHDMSQMSHCKMSCCKTSNETAIESAQFVLPDFQLTLGPLSMTSEVTHFAPQMISRSERPQSPPPKSLA